MRLIMKLLLSIFSLLIMSTGSVAQNAKLDSLYVVLESHPEEDTNRVNTLTRVCYYEYTSTPEKNKKHAEEAKRIAEKIGYAKGVGLSLRYISLYYWVKGDYERAAEFAFEMLKVFEAQGNEQGLAKAYTLIGLIHEEWNNFDKSKEYHLRSLELNQKANRIYDVAYNYNSLGALHSNFDKYVEATDYFLKSLALRKQINDEDGMSQSYINLGDCAHDAGDYNKEIEYYTLALPIAKRLGNINRLSLISQALGKVYIVKGQFGEADKLLQDALSLANQVGNKKIQRSINYNLLLLEQRRGNYKKALEYSLQVNTLLDSIFTAEKTRQMAEAEARYDSEKKEQSIELLARDNKIKALWQNIFGGGLAVMILGGFFYYRAQRSINKKNKELLRIQESVNKKLTEIDKMKSHFFASVSHEFRTPLTLIKGPIEQLLEHPEEKLTPDKAQMIHRNSNRLLQLVNQLLDLSKLDAGNLRIENSEGDLYKFLRIICSSFDSYAQQYNMTYTVQLEGASLFASFDVDKIEKIVYNLLSNAFKFTPDRGQVSVTGSYTQQTLTLKISDNGKGIEAHHLPHIFDRFYQAVDHNHTYEGTGIGLSLVKELVALLGGAVDVVSERGIGTTFTVSLPVSSIQLVTSDVSVHASPGKLYAHETVVTSSAEAHDIDKETILIIEDNPDMRSFIREHLVLDYQVLEAAQGVEGVAIATREIPDLIISDIMMPEMDGIVVCETLKKDERTSHIPVIMLTAKEGRESKFEGLQSGADEYLTKPFDSHELLVRIKNLITQRQQLRKKFSQQILLQPKNITIASVDSLFLEKVESTIEKYLSHAEFGVPQLQDALAMSKTQLHRKMKALTDQAPGEFLRNYRLKRAAQLLEQQGGTVTEIAFAVGFGSLSYFTRSFKEFFGKSPSEYGQLQKEGS
jgi:signal transduction histidine kinase/DNA-binding response OmpR family regulator